MYFFSIEISFFKIILLAIIISYLIIHKYRTYVIKYRGKAKKKHKMNYLCSGEIIDYKQIKYERNDKDARVSL